MTYENRADLLRLVGSNIKAERLKHNITVHELAMLIGLSDQTVSSIERGTRGTTIDTYARIADVFNTSIDALVGRNMNEDILYIAAPTKKTNSEKSEKLISLCKTLNADQTDMVVNFVENLLKYTKDLSAPFNDLPDDKEQ